VLEAEEIIITTTAIIIIIIQPITPENCV